MKKDVARIFEKCSSCGGQVNMTSKQHRKHKLSGQPAICDSCKQLPPNLNAKE